MQHELETPSFLLEAWEHTWEDLSRHVREGLGFVAEADGRLTGFVFGTVPRETPALLHVTDLYVAPEARRSGVARSLLHEIFGAAHERGASHVGLDVRVHNEPATALYRRLGFADEERFMTADLGTALARSEQAARPPSVASTHVQTDDELAVQRAMEQFMPRLGHSAFTEVSPPR